MDGLVDYVEREAAKRFSDLSNPLDLQAAATLAKTIAEAQKASTEAKNQTHQVRLERLKSWSSLLVPVVSLMALLGTIIFQTIQLNQQRNTAIAQSEDAEWREFVQSLRGPSKNYASDITVTSRLQVFLTSERYKVAARQLAVRVLGNLTNTNAFVELYNSTIQDQGDEKFLTILQVARALTVSKMSLDAECYLEAQSVQVQLDAPWGICTFSLMPDRMNEILKLLEDTLPSFDRRVALDRRAAAASVTEQMAFLTAQISAVLQTKFKAGVKTSEKVDLNYLALQSPDLSGVDFSAFEMSGTIFSFAKMDGAILTPRKYGNLNLGDSEWWNCQAIDGELLRWLIEYQYPYYMPHLRFYPSGPVVREHYEARVTALCAAQKDPCKPPFKFGTPPI